MLIYAMGTSDAGPIKVGMATNIKHRLKQLQCHLPYKAKAFHAVEVPDHDAPLVEAYAHRLLADKSMRGEWFAATAAQASAAIDKAAELILSGIGSVEPNGVKLKARSVRVLLPSPDLDEPEKRAVPIPTYSIRNFPADTRDSIIRCAKARGMPQGAWLAEAMLRHAGERA